MHLAIFKGAEWKKVFSHDTSGGVFANLEEAKEKNIEDEDSLLYSILFKLELFRSKYGPFHFKLCHPDLTEFSFPCNEWTQTSNPVLDSKILGFHPINITWNIRSDKKPFQGLGLSSATNFNLIDDYPPNSNWWNSIGALQNFPRGSSTIPGPKGILVKRKVLYVKYLPEKNL